MLVWPFPAQGCGKALAFRNFPLKGSQEWQDNATESLEGRGTNTGFMSFASAFLPCSSRALSAEGAGSSWAWGIHPSPSSSSGLHSQLCLGFLTVLLALSGNSSGWGLCPGATALPWHHPAQSWWHRGHEATSASLCWGLGYTH